MTGVMFHHFHGCDHIFTQGSINSNQFESLILSIGRENILNPCEYFKELKAGSLPNKYIFTFDDCIKSQFDIALPILSKYGIKAMFFVNTSIYFGDYIKLELYRDFRFSCFKDIDEFYYHFFQEVLTSLGSKIYTKLLNDFNDSDYLKSYPFYSNDDRLFRYIRDRILVNNGYDDLMKDMMEKYNYNPELRKSLLWMTENEIRELADKGHTLGLHSHTHDHKIAVFSYDQLYDEFKKNKEALEYLTSVKIFHASYPFGYVSEDLLRVMFDLNIVYAFLDNNYNSYSGNSLKLPRISHTELIEEFGISNF